MYGFYIVLILPLFIMAAICFIKNLNPHTKNILSDLITGYWPGLLLGCLIYCTLWNLNFKSPGLIHLTAALLGMALALFCDIRMYIRLPWLIIGLAAGSQLNAGHFGGYYLVLVAAFMLVTDCLLLVQKDAFTHALFIGALLFFTGQLSGFLIKEYFAFLNTILFCFGGGTIIYTASARILPENKKSSLTLLGAVIGFLSGLLIY